MNAKFLNKAVDIGLYALGGLVLLYLAGVIDTSVLYTIGSFFGFASIAAIRELFVAKAFKSRLIAVIGVVLCAGYGFGFVTEAPWADPEKFKFILYVVFGAQGLAVLHGAMKSNFKVLS